MGLFRRKTDLVTPAEALPGRATPLRVPERHYVNGAPLSPPFAAGLEVAQFGMGCFWGAERLFWQIPGVVSTSVGYAGGYTPNPTYEEVCSGRTGHTEVVRVVWDVNAVDFSDLLKLFWECHDPTQGNRQGNDVGSQYRSMIVVDRPELMDLATASRDAYQTLLSAAGFGAITTEISSGINAGITGQQPFTFAETYHQQYLAKPGSRPYCSAQPSGQRLGAFEGANYKLDPRVWEHYDWSVSHCVLRGDNSPIQLA